MIGIYIRVSSSSQKLESQEEELRKWSEAQSEPIKWYRDKATGLKMERPGFESLLNDIHAGIIKKVVILRLDRLGRTAKGLLEFFDEIKTYNCGFLSLKDSIDLSTASGRLMVTLLAGMAQFESEVRSERQQAGIEEVRRNNSGRCTWGGSVKGRTIFPKEITDAVVKMNSDGIKKITISKTLRISRPTIDRILKQLA